MRVLTRNSVFTILKIGFVASLLAGFMLMGVDLFRNLDTYTKYHLNGPAILTLTLMYFPSGILLGMGPCFLFAVTYYLSMLHASNEFICILNSGINYKRFLLPVILSSILVSGIYFVFNEAVALPIANERDARMRVITFTENGDKDSSDVAINNEDNTMLVFADKYIDRESLLLGVSLIEKSGAGKMEMRTDATRATWNADGGHWTLSHAYTYTPSEDRTDVKIEYHETLEKENFVLDPELFRNLSSEISRMSLTLAKNYLDRIRRFNRAQYAVLGTSYYQRVLGCLTPLIMMLISCGMNYRFKKNVLFFSLLCSIAIAVIYYVIQMITILLANQGIIHPAMGMIIPFISIVLLTLLFSLVMRV